MKAWFIINLMNLLWRLDVCKTIAMGKLNSIKAEVKHLKSEDKINWEEYEKLAKLIDEVYVNILEDVIESNEDKYK